MSIWVKRIVFFAVGLVIAFAMYAVLLPKPSDQKMIQDALEAAVVAGREGRPGSVLEHLSDSFEINGQQILNRSEIARFIRDQKPDVEVSSTVPTIEGSRAYIVTSIRLEMSGPMKLSANIPNVRIEFTKEPSTRFLVIPSESWRLTRVEVPSESWAQMMSGM